ncbi:ABC transporter permease subunit [Desulfosporosinus sp.]|uniref:ABC transporter permease subunit n=1 Tax=Desulfosporosinus sp. TaxID=157907 RepID=UPI0025C24B49|nr:ABC transporter permease subunit [Desulfosporosinus sp.]MBC2722895.1 ABC transporter permease subunit [Desulfosporosinus sp.]MBC2726545.1 ABC transporter permease subunit [Desulfosporosinus sp.]
MNRALFRAMYKQYRKKVAAISTGIFLYQGLLTWVYPIIAKNPAVIDIAETMPSTVKTVFGVSKNARTDTFEAFISGQFYARIWVMLMALYGVQTANALLAEMVEDGSLALLLSTPVSRSEILSTQTGVLLSTNAILVAVTIVGLFIGTFCSGIEINHFNYLLLGVLGIAFFSVIELYSLFFSAWFVEEERALTYAVGLTMAFYGLDIVGGLSDKLSWVKNFSLFQCFQPQEVLEGTVNPVLTIIGLSVTSAVLWFLTQKVFEKQDLAI